HAGAHHYPPRISGRRTVLRTRALRARRCYRLLGYRPVVQTRKWTGCNARALVHVDGHSRRRTDLHFLAACPRLLYLRFGVGAVHFLPRGAVGAAVVVGRQHGWRQKPRSFRSRFSLLGRAELAGTPRTCALRRGGGHRAFPRTTLLEKVALNPRSGFIRSRWL